MANELQLPIILLETNYGQGMVDYLGGIQQPVTLFADEYEKVFKGQKEDDYSAREEDSTLLTLMDGVRKTEHRKVFLLTSNEVRIHDAMKQRPGRLRYIKNFANLGREVIEEIVDDMLVHKELREVTIKFIAKLEQITVDIVTSLINEVNIHQVDPETFSDIFNVVKVEPTFDLVLITADKEVTVAFSQPNLEAYADGDIYETMEAIAKNTHLGTIMKIDDDGSFTVKTPEHCINRMKQAMPLGGDLFKAKNRFRVNRVQNYHAAYRQYVF